MIEKKSIEHTLIDHRIHWIKILNSNRQAIEDLFDIFTEVTRTNPENEMILYLVDSNGVTDLPIRYLIQRAEKWEKEQPYILPTRTVVLYDVNSLMRFAINMMIKQFGRYDNQTQVFSPNQKQEAIAWLISFR